MNDSDLNLQNQGKQEYRSLAKNSFYSAISIYLVIFYSLALSFLMARLISIEEWGIYILANSYIFIVVQISRTFPPSLWMTLNYFLPKYYVLEKKSKFKSFIKKSLILKLMFLIPLIILSVSLFTFLSYLFSPSLNGHIILLLILSPLIFIDAINIIFQSINRGFNNFKLNVLMFLLRFALNVCLLILFFFLNYNVTIEIIGVINVVSYLIPFIINLMVLLKYFYKLDNTEEDNLTYREVLKLSLHYGAPLIVNNFIGNFWIQAQQIGIGNLETKSEVTGFTNAISYSKVANSFSMSLNNPLVNSFTRIYNKDKFERIKWIYNFTVKYSLLISSFISGILFLSADFYLVLIYGENYLIFSPFFKLLIITVVFRILYAPLNSLISSKDKTKLLAPIQLIKLIVEAILFFGALIYFDTTIAIMTIIVAEIFGFLFYCYLSTKIGKLKLDIIPLFFQYLIFFSSLSIAVFINDIFISNLYKNIINTLNLDLLIRLPIFTILIFTVLFLALNILSKILVKKDLEDIQNLLNKEQGIEKVLYKMLSFLKKITYYD
ncbi:MAG: oligosaccharide flippase family protein [Candidatus Lokiarchaeota archaeon]|nr:oligosaccharide flippase family protein [Candidatus Lokiarchaeota archaeon]